MGDSHQAVWESDYEVIKTEWEIALKEDHHSFEVDKMMGEDQTTASNQRRYPHESEAGVQGKKRTIV